MGSMWMAVLVAFLVDTVLVVTSTSASSGSPKDDIGVKFTDSDSSHPGSAPPTPPYPFNDITIPWDARVKDLVDRLTLEEMVEQMANGGGGTHKPSPAIPRLGIKAYNFDTECLRGVMDSRGTAFPQSVGLAASFSPELVYIVAEMVGTEARGIFNNASAHGDYSDMRSISCLAPFINIMRHPLWGRVQEVYGEDPYLSGMLAAGYVLGLQGDHPRYLRANSGCKVVDVHSGPENIPVSRMSFNAEVTERDMRLTYLPNFKMCIDSGTYNLMCSFNRINGVPACANKWLLEDVLRKEFGFRGYYISDWGAIENIYTQHHYVNSSLEAAVAAANAGVNLELPPSTTPAYLLLTEAVHKNMVPLSTIRERVKPLFYTRMRLGEFDPPHLNPYTSINTSVIQSDVHRKAAVEVATKTFVLLKNDKHVLPLTTRPSNMAVVGPMSNNLVQLFGSYSPVPQPEYSTTPLQGLKTLTDNVRWAAGCDDNKCANYQPDSVKQAVTSSDVVVVCLGTGQQIETEGSDRADLSWPGHQLQLLQDAVAAAKPGSPVILLLFTAGPIDISWAVESPGVHAIVQCFLPAQATGLALAKVLAVQQGKVVSPAARLPYTWPANMNQIPPMVNYSMEGRTYRYFKGPGDPQFPFGYGLSYSTFHYDSLKISPTSVKAGNNVTVEVTVTNTGTVEADEVTQVYIKWVQPTVPMPQLQLVAVSRKTLAVNTPTKHTFTVQPHQMQVWDDHKGFIYHLGEIEVYVGGQQPGQTVDVGSNVLSGTFKVT